jgi:peptidoglycan hydrolase CwlO-like protein
LIGLSLLLLIVSTVVGFLNRSEINGRRAALANAVSLQEVATRLRLVSEQKLRAREKEVSGLTNKIATAEARIGSAEAELRKSQAEKADLESKLQASEARVSELQKHIGVAAATEGSDSRENRPDSKLKAQPDDTKRQMETLEHEKATLVEKLKAAQDRVTAMEEEKVRRGSRARAAGIHGTVLAVNQAYNFVVLSMGERQGVVPNSEMLVMRGGTLIGKIRISSVEPTTSIGDIITDSLARGVQVQPGDTVVYGGNASS